MFSSVGAVVPAVIEEKAEPKEKKVTKNDPRLVAAARECGLAAPINEAVAELIRGVERSWASD